MGKLLGAGFAALAAAWHCGPLAAAATDGTVAAISDAQFDRQFRCPEAFSSNEERKQSLTDYLAWASARHPDWTVKDMLDRRYELLVRHRCTETLRNIERNSGDSH